VEIPLPLKYRFHSTFVCPVAKEIATKANPAMIMPCGHTICQESLQRLTRSNGYGLEPCGNWFELILANSRCLRCVA